MDYTKEQLDHFITVFDKYEEKFGENLFSAWDFDSVDWKGLAKEAEKCIKSNIKLTDDQKEKYYGTLKDKAVY